MNNETHMQRSILIITYIARGASILLISIFFILLFSEGGHLNHPHLQSHDLAIFLFIPLLYSIGAFYSFKNELYSGIIIFISFIGYNATIQFFDNLSGIHLEYTFMLIPSILFVILYLFRKHEEVRRDEFQRLFGEYEHLSQNYKIIQSMLEITPELLKDNNLDNLLQLILEKAVDAIPRAQFGSILIRNKDQMIFRAAVGYNLDLLKKINLRFEDMYQYKLGNLYEPQVIRDIRTFNHANMNPQNAKDLDDQDALVAKSVLTCAITVRDEIYGFINLDNIEDVNAFQDKDKIYIKHLAQQIEMALKNQFLVEDIYKLSKFDSLTGAYTRKYHQTMLREVYDKAKKSKTPFSICALDIDELKSVNDQFGHEIGDQYLIQFSEIIKNSLKENEIFSRTGGDEFILVFPKCNKLCVEKKVNDLKEIMSKKPLIQEKKSIPLSFGYGIATFIEDSEYLDELISLSDKRLYMDKKHRS